MHVKPKFAAEGVSSLRSGNPHDLLQGAFGETHCREVGHSSVSSVLGAMLASLASRQLYGQQSTSAPPNQHAGRVSTCILSVVMEAWNLSKGGF